MNTMRVICTPSPDKFLSYVPADKLAAIKASCDLKCSLESADWLNADIAILWSRAPEGIRANELIRAMVAPGSRIRAIALMGPASRLEVDIRQVTAQGIAISHAPFPEDLAVFTIAQIINLARRTFEAHDLMKRQVWNQGDREHWNNMPGESLRDKVLGIVGLGNTGYRIAEIAGVLGMKVLVHTRTNDPAKIGKVGVPASLNTLLRDSDYISVNVPLNSATRKMISKAQFAQMKRSACLINIARGGIVDQAALYEALKDGTIRGAALDVFETEPPDPGDPLLQLPNVHATPHYAGCTNDRYAGQAAAVADEVLRLLRGETPQNLYNPDVLLGPNKLSLG
jgi:phosphoglycerate dehydrogenase-like enzyme